MMWSLRSFSTYWRYTSQIIYLFIYLFIYLHTYLFIIRWKRDSSRRRGVRGNVDTAVMSRRSQSDGDVGGVGPT